MKQKELTKGQEILESKSTVYLYRIESDKITPRLIPSKYIATAFPRDSFYEQS